MNQSLEQVKDCLLTNKSFILEAGAGSGKTWTLIESLKLILEIKASELERRNKHIACITYTNVAKNEIIERIENNPLVLVLTIHEFLWLAIKNFQIELKNEILKYNEADQRKHVEDLEYKIENVTIEYSQYGRKFEKGKITHEDVLEFSSCLFKSYPKLSYIVANKFPYIFIDEYQDTEQRTVELLLDNILADNKDNIVIGFFGDSMQKIYNQGIGKIPKNYIDDGRLTFITKTENYRCSTKVIELLGKIRPDLIQIPAGNNLQGEICFVHCNNNLANSDNNYSTTLKYLTDKKGWAFDKDTKILLLTHKSIANKLGYENLLGVYDTLDFGRDRLLNKEELFSNFFLSKVENLIQLFNDKNYREFINQLDIDGFKINYHGEKSKVQSMMIELIKLRNENSVLEVMNYLFENKLLTKPIRLDEFEIEIRKDELDESQAKRKKFYDTLMQIKYSEFILINDYIEKYTPYSTKHGVKGAEFANVLVVIDDASWNQYKFNDVFSSDKANQGRFDRSLNLLYVCCSRAKNNLALLSLSAMDVNAMNTITNWFGGENVYNINTLPIVI